MNQEERDWLEWSKRVQDELSRSGVPTSGLRPLPANDALTLDLLSGVTG
jgi:hypothetical protein